MSWRCWSVICSLVAALSLIELTTQGFSRNLRLQNGLKLSSKRGAEKASQQLGSDHTSHQNTTTLDGGCVYNTTFARPWFIMHVGPPKTATTTLQIEMGTLVSLQRLAQDDYLYIGRDSRYTDKSEEYGMKPFRILTDSGCHLRVRAARLDNTSMPECWQEFMTDLNELQGMNMIASDERWGFMDSKVYWDWQAIRESLSERFNLRIVVSYRRFSEWLLSVYSQQQRESMYARRKWPQQHGAPPVTPLFSSLQVLMNNPYPFKYLYTDTLVSKLKRFNITVDILNLHSENGIMPTLMCGLVPNANRSCRKSIERHATNLTKRSNVALNFDYDTIACKAAELGLLDMELHQRPEVAKLAAVFHQEILNATELPMKCPSKAELQPLLQRSLELESKILPDFYKSPLGKTAHEQDFWQAVDNHKFCSINVQAVLQQEAWRRFFMNLDNNTDINAS